MSSIIEINDDVFEQEINNAKCPVIVDFWATWCGPCRKLTPVLEDIINDYGEKIKLLKLNIEQNKESAKKYSISGIPCLLIFKDGKPVERLVGLMPKSTIISNIEKHI